ncbi:tetratricopeptide repeat protein [Streptomyces sp. NPDC058256]|uniref:tetratricopeptide repeat protein n=1 Tax=Streptomyces sp. NPDC058256 TaxID=3346408 RepID=UPI0036E9C313
MSRLSREQKRELKRRRAEQDGVSGEHPAAGVTPIEVRVPAPAGGAAPVGGEATVGGMPVVAAPGETVQDAVLNHLHRIALSIGQPVLALIHDERTGFVVPIQVYVDGSSQHMGEPQRFEPQQQPPEPRQVPQVPQTQQHEQPPAPVRPRPSLPVTPTAPQAEPVWPPAAEPVWPPAATGPEPRDTSYGVAAPPTGVFGPAPGQAPARETAMSLMRLGLEPGPEPEPDPKPTPPRGFDAVAESVLAPVQEGSGEAAFLVEPVARINEAVKEGRIEEAAGMAERAVAEGAQALGPEHPEVLRLRELSAYIAYLAGDAVRSFHLSLDLARVLRRHRDLEAAYGNVQSAATAWRAVRDPLQGLNLGRDLIDVWTELAAAEGPAADDIEQLEKARTRMGRLTERARDH